MRSFIDFDAINEAACRHLESICRSFLPYGRRERNEWRVGSLQGKPGSSLGICLTGSKVGVWKDFATGESADPVSMVAAIHGTGQAEAARLLADMLGVEVA